MDEGVPFIETEENECEIPTEQTTFDPICRKAKKFPVLSTSKTIGSSSLKALVLTRKRTRESQLELHSAIEVLGETDMIKILRENAVLLDMEYRNEQQYSYGGGEEAAVKQHDIKSLSSFNVIEVDMPIDREICSADDRRIKDAQ